MKAFLILATVATLAIGCSKNSDDGGGNGGGRFSKSVVGASAQVGVFPDGTKAEPLTPEQMEAISKSAEGASKINEAINAVSPSQGAGAIPGSLRRSGNAEVEAVQAFFKSSVFKSVLRLRAVTGDIEQLKQQMKQNCVFTQNPNQQPSQTESGNTFISEYKGWSYMSGTACPMDSKTDFGYRLVATRTGENSADLAGTLQISSASKLLNVQDQNAFDYVGQNVSGLISGEAVINNQALELGANGNITGLLQTPNDQLNVEALFDIYATGVPATDEHGQSYTKINSGRLVLAIVLKANAAKVLMQVFAEGTEGNSTVKVYLNGQEMKQDGSQSGSSPQN